MFLFDRLDACTDELLYSDEKFNSDVEDVTKRKLLGDSGKRSFRNSLPTSETEDDNSKSFGLPVRCPSINTLEKYVDKEGKTNHNMFFRACRIAIYSPVLLLTFVCDFPEYFSDLKQSLEVELTS